VAVRPNLDVRVGVSVVGPMANPRVRLFSEPDMSEMEKLSWLVLGRGSDGLGTTDTALLQSAAIALLAGEDRMPSGPLMEQLGLTTFSMRQSDGETRETIVSIGRQLSQRWYVGYERSVNATTGTWQLIYRVARRLTVRAQSGVENALDVIWSWRW
jgi:translocation and assembly module TamB